MSRWLKFDGETEEGKKRPLLHFETYLKIGKIYATPAAPYIIVYL